MKKLKRYIGWATFIPAAIAVIALDIIGCIGWLIMEGAGKVSDGLSAWQGWCAGYYDRGWEPIGGGFWRKKQK